LAFSPRLLVPFNVGSIAQQIDAVLNERREMRSKYTKSFEP